jgi:hypothetical protein
MTSNSGNASCLAGQLEAGCLKNILNEKSCSVPMIPKIHFHLTIGSRENGRSMCRDWGEPVCHGTSDMSARWPMASAASFCHLRRQDSRADARFREKAELSVADLCFPFSVGMRNLLNNENSIRAVISRNFLVEALEKLKPSRAAVS